MSNPADIVADLLVTAGVGAKGSQSSWGIFIGIEPVTPKAAITVYNTGGRMANPAWRVDYPSVQVRIRGVQNGYTASRAKAQAVKDALLGIASQTLGSGDRLISIALRGDIIDLGMDPNNQPLHTVNLDLILEPVSGTHRLALA